MTTVSTLKAQIVADASGLVDGLSLTKAEIRAAAKVARDAMTDFERFEAEKAKATRLVAGGLLSPDAAARHVERFIPTATLVPQLGDFASKANLTADAAQRLGVDVTDMQRAFGVAPLAINPAAIALGGITTAAGLATGAVAALGAVVADRIHELDALGDAAERLGVSASALSMLRGAARLGDIDPAMAETMLQKMLVNIGKGHEALTELGLDLDTLRTSDPSLAFEAIAEAIGGIPTKAERMAVIQEIFGKTGPEAAILIERFAELRTELDSLGATASDRLVGQAGKFDDALTRLKLTGEGLANALTSRLVPSLNMVASGIEAASKHETAISNWSQFMGVIAGGGTGRTLAAVEVASLLSERRKIAEEVAAARKAPIDAAAEEEQQPWFSAKDWEKAADIRKRNFLKLIEDEAREEERRAKEKADEEKRIRGEKWAEEMRKIDEAQKVIEGLKLPSEKVADKLSEDMAALELAGMSTPERRDALIRRAAGELAKSEGGGGFGAPGADKGTRAAREAVLSAQHQAEQVHILKRIETRLRDMLGRPTLVVEEIDAA